MKHPYEIGKKYLIRTVTMTLTGLLTKVYKNELALQEACWIPDTGRFSEALNTGELYETEPFPGDVIVGRAAVVDCCEWAHDLPRSVK